jgi:ATP-dependent DNA ligase
LPGASLQFALIYFSRLCLDDQIRTGKRSGAWIKHRLNLGQEFVVGGYTPGPHGLDAIIVGYYRRQGADLRRSHAKRLCSGLRAARV